MSSSCSLLFTSHWYMWRASFFLLKAAFVTAAADPLTLSVIQAYNDSSMVQSSCNAAVITTKLRATDDHRNRPGSLFWIPTTETNVRLSRAGPDSLLLTVLTFSVQPHVSVMARSKNVKLMVRSSIPSSGMRKGTKVKCVKWRKVFSPKGSRSECGNKVSD